MPLCLVHIDGLMQKTTKSSLLKKQETQVISAAPSNIGTFVTDAMFLL